MIDEAVTADYPNSFRAEMPAEDVRQGPRSCAAKANNKAHDRDGIASVASASRHGTACFSCRTARQRCDRLEPCARCVVQARPCSYASMSHRGRKEGSSNKPDTVEKLLLRISQSPVGDQLVQAILDSAASQPGASNKESRIPGAGLTLAENCHLPPSECAIRCTHAAEPKCQQAIVSPLDILAAAVTAVSGDDDRNSSQQSFAPSLNSSPSGLSASETQGLVSADGKLVTYLASQPTLQKDWQILSAQPVESTFKLEPTACDPLAARIIDETDSYLFFNQFFTTRNPVLGLLDPELHTPEKVYSASFTLFSVICALGCAVSARPRDRVIHQALLVLAEGNMQWSIAASVRSLETIQAIVLMQYWARIRHRVSDDPYWLHLSHAAQLAREMGIHKPSHVDKFVAGSGLAADNDSKERLRRSYERCWLCLFIADKSLGTANGRRLCISWDDIPRDAYEWWRRPGTSPGDRLICGIVETRGILVNAFEERNGADQAAPPVSGWYSRWIDVFEHVRSVRCMPDGLPSSTYMPLLAFHIDHSILMLNAQAVRELMSSDVSAMSAELAVIYQKTAQVAVRMLDAILHDACLGHLMGGFHNSHFIMICHAMAEIRQAISRNTLPREEAAEAISKARSIPDRLNEIVQHLPTASAGRLYVNLARFLVNRMESYALPVDEQSEPIPGLDDAWMTDWWLGDGLYENGFTFADSLDMGRLIFDSDENRRGDGGGELGNVIFLE